MDKFKCQERSNRCVRKSASVSDQIIEYYYKFGQNRDLERFLRLRRSSSYNKSSSESSLCNPGTGLCEHISNRCSRSLNYIEKECNKTTETSNSTKNASTSTENEPRTNNNRSKSSCKTTSNINKSPETDHSNIRIFSQEKVYDKSTKSLSFSCESNIAINIHSPPLHTVSMPNLKITRKSPKMLAESPPTDSDLKVSDDRRKSKIPITIKDEKYRKEPTETKSSDYAVLSNKRLEWDSIGDVGYKKTTSPTSITALERSVLKDFFAQRGIEVNFPTDNSDKLAKIIQEPQTPNDIADTQRASAMPKHSNEKWRQTLESIKKKYSSSLFETESFSKVPQSTPILPKTGSDTRNADSHITKKSIENSNSIKYIQSKATQCPSQQASLIRKSELICTKISASNNTSNKYTQSTPKTGRSVSSTIRSKVDTLYNENVSSDTPRLSKCNTNSSDSFVNFPIEFQYNATSKRDTKSRGYTEDSKSSSNASDVLNDYQSVAIDPTDKYKLETSKNIRRISSKKVPKYQSTATQQVARLIKAIDTSTNQSGSSSIESCTVEKSKNVNKVNDSFAFTDFQYKSSEQETPNNECSRDSKTTSILKDFQSIAKVQADEDNLQFVKNIQRCMGNTKEPSYQTTATQYTPKTASLISLTNTTNRTDPNLGPISLESKEPFVEPNLETIEQKMINLEKYCQTSFIGTQSQEVQVNFSKRNSVQSSSDLEFVASPSSFEYIENQTKSSNKENETPPVQIILCDKNMNSSSSTENDLRKSIHELFESQEANSKVSKKVSKPDSKKSNELELGVQLLCSLIESKNLNDKQKKSLARKIVMKITKHHSVGKLLSGISTETSASSLSIRSLLDYTNMKQESNSHSALSSSSTGAEKSKSLSNSSLIRCHHDGNADQSATVKIISDEDNSNKSADDQETMREWLDPLTISEKNYDKKKNTPPNSQRTQNQKEHIPKSQDELKQKLKHTEVKEFESHLSWIELEIKRLEYLKKRLLIKDELKPSESFIQSPAGKHHQYDNVAESTRPNSSNTYTSVTFSKDSPSSSTSRQHGPPSKVLSVADKKTLLKPKNATAQIFLCKSLENVYNPVKDYSRSMCRKSKIITILDGETENIKDLQKTTKIIVEEKQNFPKRCYNLNKPETNNSEKHRSKIDTPPILVENESIKTFARQRKKEFLDLYENKEHDYDCLAESDHYSEPRERRAKQTLTNKVPYLTSTTCSSYGISSASMSVPITNNSSTTTTHQYDGQVAIGIQTGDSVLETVPIYGTQICCGSQNLCDCSCKKATTRVYKQDKNRVVQVKPDPVAYNITFNGAKKSESKLNNNSSKRYPDKYFIQKKKESSAYSLSSSKDSDIKKIDKQNDYHKDGFLKTVENRYLTNCKTSIAKTRQSTFNSTSMENETNGNIKIVYSTSSQVSNDSLTLQEHLKKQRPEFVRCATKRQKVLKKLHNQRLERNKKIQEIVENTSMHSLPRKLEELPPPPIHHTKIFTTREKKALTMRKYCKLADVQAKVDQKIKDKSMKNIRALTKVFNKKLQRRVHSGQPSLNFSTTVI